MTAVSFVLTPPGINFHPIVAADTPRMCYCRCNKISVILSVLSKYCNHNKVSMIFSFNQTGDPFTQGSKGTKKAL